MQSVKRSKWKPMLFAVTMLALSACVTINVYFPAAEAQQAAEEFVGKVINGDKATPEENKPADPKPMPQASRQPSFNLMSFFISDAAAQEVDITIRTPAIQAIQNRMSDRFTSSLRQHFDAGALGFSNDGLIVVHDATKVPLKDRVTLTQLVADDNRDRKAVYREIAVANGHPEWEEQIRDTFAKQWVRDAKAGWWYQTSAGAWKQK
ncbi:MAG: YdbL family protein [Arenimonas sp.]